MNLESKNDTARFTAKFPHNQKDQKTIERERDDDWVGQENEFF